MGAFSLCQDTRRGAAFIVAVAAVCELCKVEVAEVERDQRRGVEFEDAGSEDDSCGSWGAWKWRLVRRADAEVLRTMERRTGLANDHGAAELNTTLHSTICRCDGQIERRE
jgi:hypothetical protein